MLTIPLKARVECTDGICGESATVIINPIFKTVTHFVLIDKTQHKHEQRLVPIEYIINASMDSITLDCSKVDLAQMEPFIETRYIESPVSDIGYSGGGYDTVYLMPYTVPENPKITPHESERIPEGELAIHRGMHVEATDGVIGQVGEFLIDEDSGTITHLVLLEGHLFGEKEVTLPISAVSVVTEKSIYLNLDKNAVNASPEIKRKRFWVKL
jgi:hypothetical protein